MDPYEATKIVFSRIQNLDPENASKIMGLLLIQDHGEKEMIRLAFGPENSLQSLVVKARQELGVSSLLSPTNTQPPSPFLSNNTNSADTTCTTPAITMSATTAINSSNNNGNNPFSVSRKNSTSTTNATRFLPNGVKIPSTLTIPSLNSPNHLVSSPSWAASVFSNFRIPDDQLLFSPNDSSPAFLSAAAAAFYKGISSSHLGLNSNSATTNNNNNTNTVASTAASSSMNSSTPPFYPSGRTASAPDLIDEIKLQGQLSFLNNSNSAHASLGPRNHPDLYYPQPDLSSGPGDNSDPLVISYNGGVEDSWGGVGSVDGLSHRRSCSVNDINFGSEGSGLDDLTCGFGWKPCLYYARGYCKNGSSCRFVHVGLGEADSAAAAPSFVGSPTKFEMMEQCHEILRSKSMQQQKLMAAMAFGNPKFPYSPGNKCLNFLLQQQPTESQRVAAAAALMMGEDMHKFGRSRLDTSEFMMNGRPDSNPSSRQIYLTFPADSTFREEDVSNYFSIYGPVQDVRIPYQQKRMFGFVTFVCPETVKMILAKGNPHFVCDARVLVKPYKEKGKVPEKYRKQHQQQVIDRGEFSACNSPIAPDFRDPLDVQNLGARMMYNNTQEMLWRKMEEQADLQQALDLQNRRLMGLHLLDVKRNHHHRTLSTGGGAIPSPTQSPNSFFHHSLLRSDRSSPEAPEENDSNNEVTAAGGGVNDKKLHRQSVDNETEKDQKQGPITVRKEDDNGNGSGEEDSSREYSCLPESLEHNLPDSPFASPSKGAGACMPAFLCSNVAGEPEDAAAKGNLIALSSLPAASAVDMASFKSCYVQMPRFSPGHGAIGM